MTAGRFPPGRSPASPPSPRAILRGGALASLAAVVSTGAAPDGTPGAVAHGTYDFNQGWLFGGRRFATGLVHLSLAGPATLIGDNPFDFGAYGGPAARLSGPSRARRVRSALRPITQSSGGPRLPSRPSR